MDYTNIIVLIALILSFIGLSWFAGTDAPYVPTTNQKLLEVLKAAGVKKKKCFYELGSGDGRVVIEAAKLGANAYGIEQSWIRIWYSRWKAYMLNLKSCYFYHGNLFDRHYYPADVVYLYMLQPAIDRLETKLKEELSKGAVIVTQTYHFKKLRPFKKIDKFWLYKI